MSDHELILAIRRLNQLTADRGTVPASDPVAAAAIRERLTLSSRIGQELVDRNAPFRDPQSGDEWWPSDTVRYPTCLRASWDRGHSWVRQTNVERRRAAQTLIQTRHIQRCLAAERSAG